MKIGMQPDIRHRPKDAFEFAANHGFDHVELLLDHPFYAMCNLSYAEVIELRWSYELDVLIHAPSASINFISLSNNIRRASYKELSEVCQFAEKCGAEVVTFHIGWNPGFIANGEFFFEKELYDEHNERVLMDELYYFVKDCPVPLALENTILIDGGLRNALDKIIADTDLKLTFDIGHYNIQKNEFFIDNFEKVVNIHLHDNNGKKDEHLALGRGNINLDVIPLNDYRGFLTIETRKEEAILETKKYIFNYLKLGGGIPEGERN